MAKEDLSDQELPIVNAALSAAESLPCEGNALSSAANLIKLGSRSIFWWVGMSAFEDKQT